jgi:hypothetical protein
LEKAIKVTADRYKKKMERKYKKQILKELMDY